MKEKPWFIYLVRCKDGSLYCGVTTDPQRRFRQHVKGTAAKYTRAKGAVELAWVSGGMTKSRALRGEHKVKRAPKQHKESLLKETGPLLGVLKELVQS